MGGDEERFTREAEFLAPPERVAVAARAFVSETLAWRVADTDGGFTAHGRCLGRTATASFRIAANPAGHGTTLAIALVVEGVSGPLGGRSDDAYVAQMAEWLGYIRQRLHHPAAVAATSRLLPRTGRLGRLLIGFGILLVALYFVILPVVGLATGQLLLCGRGSGCSVIEGPWARITSAGLLLLSVFLIFWIRSWQRKRDRGFLSK